jgi:hypothetical protein
MNPGWRPKIPRQLPARLRGQDRRTAHNPQLPPDGQTGNHGDWLTPATQHRPTDDVQDVAVLDLQPLPLPALIRLSGSRSGGKSRSPSPKRRRSRDTPDELFHGGPRCSVGIASTVNTFGVGLTRRSVGLARISYVFGSSQSLQGLEYGSSRISGTVFPQVRGPLVSKCARVLTNWSLGAVLLAAVLWRGGSFLELWTSVIYCFMSRAGPGQHDLIRPVHGRAPGWIKGCSPSCECQWCVIAELRIPL